MLKAHHGSVSGKVEVWLKYKESIADTPSFLQPLNNHISSVESIRKTENSVTSDFFVCNDEDATYLTKDVKYVELHNVVVVI